MLKDCEFRSKRRRLFFLLFFLFLVLGMTARASAQPTFSKAFSPDKIGPGNMSVLTFTINNTDTNPVRDLAFTDNLPAGVTIADNPGISNTCEGAVTAIAGQDTIGFTDGRLLASSSCSILVNVTAATPGTYNNTSGDLTSTAGNSGPAADALDVVTDLPSFSKAFSPNSITLRTTSTLTFTIDNTGGSKSFTNVAFSDTLPSGLTAADPANESTTCGGTVTADSGNRLISLSGGTLASGNSCTVSVDIYGDMVGVFGNVTDSLSVDEATDGTLSVGAAQDEITVTPSTLSMTKDFLTNPVTPGATTPLTFTIYNYDRTGSSTDIAFTDDLDGMISGMTVIGSALTDPCGSGSSFSGTSLLELTGGSLGPGASCTFSVTVQVPGSTALGTYQNTTSTLTGNLDGNPVTGPAASASLTLQPGPTGVKTFTPTTAANGDAVHMDFTITNTSTTSDLTNIGFIDDFFSGVTLTGSDKGTCTGILVPSLISGNWRIQYINGTLSAGTSCTLTADLTVDAGMAPGTYYNTISDLAGIVDSISYTAAPATASLTVYGPPVVQQSITDNPVVPGAQTTLQFTIINHDTTNAVTNIDFTEDLDGVLTGLASASPTQNDICGTGSSLTGDTSLTFTGGNLAAGEMCSFSVTLDTPGTAGSGSYTLTTSNITANVGVNPVTASPSSTDIVFGELSMTKSFIDDPALPGGTVDLQFEITNISTGSSATSIGFQDNLQGVLSGLVPSSTAPVNDVCGASSQLTWNDATSTNKYLELTGGNLLASGSCQFTVTLDVPSSAATGTYGNVTTNFQGDMGSGLVSFQNALDSLDVNNELLELTKSFTDDPLPPNGTGTLSFTITNTDATRTVTDITFTDDLDAALSGLVATVLPSDDTCGVGSTMTGTNLLTFSGGSLAPGANCTLDVTIQVPSGAVGGSSATNTTSAISGKVGLLDVTGLAASDDLQINNVAFSKSFAGSVLQYDTTTLTFTIENKNTSGSMELLTFTDDLNSTLSGLTATDTPLSAPCGDSSALTGTSTLTLSRGSLAPGDTCSFDVTVQTPFSGAAGNYTNTTSVLMTDTTTVAEPATATLSVTTRYYTISGTLTDSGTSQPISGATVTFSHDSSTATTDASGNYSKSVPLGTNTVLTPSKTGYASWSPSTATFNSLNGNKSQNFSGTLATYTITGQVTDGTNPLQGVTLTFSHDSGTTQTDASGNYTYTVNYGTTTTVTPSKTGYQNWSPASKTFTSITSNQSQNFQADIITYTITGQVTDGTNPLQGVTLTFSHNSGTAQTDASGNYTYTVDYGTTTTVTPSKTGYHNWSPTNKTFTSITSNQSQNFQGDIITYTITGQVTDGTNPLQGVTLTFSHDSGTAQTDASGNYTYTVDYGTTTTVTPSKTGYQNWSPANQTFTSITSNQSQNFQGAIVTYTITGQVTAGTNPLQGVTLTFSHDSGTTQTDASGNYTYTVDYGTTTTVTPSKTGYQNWSPADKTFSNITGNQSQNFQSDIITFTITGQVTDGTDPLQGATLTFSHDSGTTQTNDSGNYTYTVNYGTTTTVTPSKTGYVSWAPTNRTLTNMTTNQSGQDFIGTVAVHDLTVQKDGDGEGTITSNPAGIDCGSTCMGSYDYGTTVTLTATPDTGDGFDGWSGGGCTGTDTCQVVVESDQTVTATFNELPRADLSVTKQTDTYSPGLGDEIGFIVRVTNLGPENATEVALTDILPAGLTYLSDNSGGTYNPGTGVWTVGTLAAEETVDLMINASYDTDGVVTNTVQITHSGRYDPVAENNSASVTIDASAVLADLAVWKLGVPKPVTAGENLLYFLSVNNLGPASASNVELTDLFSTNISGVEYRIAGGGASYAPWPGTNVLSLGTLDPLDFKTIWVRGTLAAVPSDGSLANTVQVESTTPDPVTGNNSAADLTPVPASVPYCDLSVVKSADKETVVAGDILVFTITAANNGPDNATGIQVLDFLSPGLTYASDDGGTAYDNRSGIWTVGALNNGASATLQITSNANSDAMILNSAFVNTDSCRDIYPANNSSTLVVNGETGADLALWSDLTGLGGASLDMMALANGDQYTYVVQFENNGSTVATGVQVQVTLPGGVAVTAAVAGAGCYDTSTNIWHVDDPAACATTLGNQEDTVNNGVGNVLTLTLEITDAAAVGTGQVTAQIIEPPTDPDITNNTVTRALEPGDDFLVDLSVNVVVNKSVINDLETGVITVTVRNNGPDEASSVQIQTQIPAALVLSGAYPSTGTYRRDTGLWMIGNLAVNNTATLELNVTPAGNDHAAVFTVQVAGVAETELNAANNTRQVIIDVTKTLGGGGGGGGCFLDELLCR